MDIFTLLVKSILQGLVIVVTIYSILSIYLFPRILWDAVTSLRAYLHFKKIEMPAWASYSKQNMSKYFEVSLIFLPGFTVVLFTLVWTILYAK